MDRREINDIEAERGDVGHARDAVIEGPMPAGDAALAAWHHFTPGAATRARARRQQGNGMAARQIRLRLRLLHRGSELIFEQKTNVAFCSELLGMGFDDEPRLALARLELDQKRVAFARRQRKVLPGLLAQSEFLAPGGEPVGPRLNREQIGAWLQRREMSVPAIIVVQGHWLPPPAPLGCR